MTKSTITRERLEEIVSDPMINQGSEFATIARMARAYMEMCDQMIEIAKCFLVIDDIRKIIRIINDKDWNDTNGFRRIQTDIGKELESVIDGLIDQIKPSLSPRPDEIKEYIRETLIEKGLYDGLRLALSNAGIAAPESDETLAVKQELYVQELVTWVKDRKPFQPAPAADSEPDRNPVLAYADSYRDMAKQGLESVPIWSVITDLERNIAPLYRHAQPAPTCESITITDDMAYAFHHALTDSMIGADDVEEIKTGLRAVLANLTAPVVSAEYPDRLPCSVLLEPGLRFGKGIKTSTMLAALARRAVYESDMAALSPEERAEFQARIEDFKALIAQPGTVVPDEKDKTVDADDHPLLWSFNEGWNACRAAMLAVALQEVKGE
ncbi:hypothetical protein AAHY02_06800 [Klebsiella variicola subsp. variicola]|uniref:hypothetical protein n=1 Tax=Klebsiella variicola TaxID=244366 RepID=UPI0035A39A3B